MNQHFSATPRTRVRVPSAPAFPEDFRLNCTPLAQPGLPGQLSSPRPADESPYREMIMPQGPHNGKWCPMAESVAGGCSAHLASVAQFLGLTPEPLSPQNVKGGLELAGLCFHLEDDREQLLREYENVSRGHNSFFEPALQHLIIVHADFLYKLRGKPVAMAGVYQYAEEQDRMWLSWFGVHPEYRQHGFGTMVLKHMEQLAAAIGAQRFAAYTEDNIANAGCHCFYERQGYLHTATFEVNGEPMRTYEKALRLAN